jgi:hypothetical protein
MKSIIYLVLLSSSLPLAANELSSTEMDVQLFEAIPNVSDYNLARFYFQSMFRSHDAAFCIARGQRMVEQLVKNEKFDEAKTLVTWLARNRQNAYSENSDVALSKSVDDISSMLQRASAFPRESGDQKIVEAIRVFLQNDLDEHRLRLAQREKTQAEHEELVNQLSKARDKSNSLWKELLDVEKIAADKVHSDRETKNAKDELTAALKSKDESLAKARDVCESEKKNLNGHIQKIESENENLQKQVEQLSIDAKFKQDKIAQDERQLQNSESARGKAIDALSKEKSESLWSKTWRKIF